MKRFFAAIVMLAILIALASTALAAGMTVTAASPTVSSGTESVTVELTLSGNDGIAGLMLSVAYDDALTLTKIDGGTALTGLSFTPGGDLRSNPVRLLWDGQEADSTNGVVARLTFTVPEKAGKYPVRLTAVPGSVFDNDLKNVDVTVNDGTIQITGTGGGSSGTSGGSGTSGTSGGSGTSGTSGGSGSFGTGGSGGSSGGQTADGGQSVGEIAPPRFHDVAETSWYNAAVEFVATRGLMSGTGESAFSPEDAMTRAMVMTVLARYAGIDTSGGATWYEKGMNWAKDVGVSDGTNPRGNVTREQLVTMLYRYLNSPAVTGELRFSDTGSISPWAMDAIRWAVASRIIGGMGDNTMSPQGNATRAQVATILMRFVQMNQ